MKKSFFATIFLWGLLLLSCFFLPEVAYAEDSNSIERIDMNVSIDANGTAHIKEVWRASVYQGTEGYRPYGNLGACEITDFSVSDDLGNHYELQDHWDTNGFFVDKRENVASLTTAIHLSFAGESPNTETGLTRLHTILPTLSINTKMRRDFILVLSRNR